jgi:3-oxoadipate enol-lactonase/4-carboxymuconolactone decarboxylase
MTVPRLNGVTRPAAHGDESAGLLVLLPSLGTSSAVWDAAVAELATALPQLRILTVDLPGHGKSPAAREEFSIAELADATLRLVDEAGADRFHVAGLSLGGAVALGLAAAHPHRVLSFSSFCSGSRIGDTAGWTERAALVRSAGTGALIAASAGRWFAPGYLDAPGSAAAADLLAALAEVDDESYALCCDALGVFDRTPSLAAVRVAGLIVSGEHDPVITSESVREFASELPNADCAEIAGAAHLAPLESPAAAAELLVARIRSAQADADQRAKKPR